MDDEYLIHQSKTEFREGFNAADADRVLACFSSAGFSNYSDGLPSFWGDDARRALRLQLDETFAAYRVELVVIIVATTILGDTAFSRGWHKFVLFPKTGGEPQRRHERYLEIWCKEPEGGWKIRHYMTNRESTRKMVEQIAGHAALQPYPEG